MVKFTWRLKIGLLFLVMSYLGCLWYLTPDREELDRLVRSVQAEVVSAYGKNDRIEIQSVEFSYHFNIGINNISRHVINAVVASEDKNFYAGEDQLVFLRGNTYKILNFLRQATLCIASKILPLDCRGGSTISQQLSKELLPNRRELSGLQLYHRKFVELAWSIAIDNAYDRDQMMEHYLNRVYMGRTNSGRAIYGVEQAARAFFNMRAARLNEYEATILIAALKSPVYYGYISNRAGSKQRASLILAMMADQNLIDAAIATKPIGKWNVRRGTVDTTTPVMSWHAQEIRKAIFPTLQGLPPGRYKVLTTFNAEHQVYAEKAIDFHVKKSSAGQGAMLSIQKDGAVLSLIGGESTRGREMNRTQRPPYLYERPAASTLKMLLYLLAFEEGYPLRHKLSMTVYRHIRNSGFSPKNAQFIKGKFASLKQCLILSINTCTVNLLDEIGVERFLEFLEDVGITINPSSGQVVDHSVALGRYPISLQQLTASYLILPAGGCVPELHFYRSIYDASGSLVSKRIYRSCRSIVSKESASKISQLLEGVMKPGGTAAGHVTSRMKQSISFIGGKTGTTDEGRDGLFVGITDHITTAVWLGNDVPIPAGLSGGNQAVKVWRDYIQALVTQTNAFAIKQS